MSGATPGLTAEQDAPIRLRGASVALSAGAGCGKTTVLTGRFLAALEGESPLTLDRVAALTFTEKAARELRDRVRRACRARGDSPYWRGILRDLEAARIGTFHAFCATILRRFAIAAGVDPAFEVLDDSLAPTLREAAVDGCLRRWLASGDPALFTLAVEIGLPSVREALLDFLARRPDLDLDLWAGRRPEEIVSLWESHRDGPVVRSLVESLDAEARPLVDLLAEHEVANPKMMARRAALLDALPRLREARDVATLLAEIKENATIQHVSPKAWPSDEVKAAYKAGLEALRERIKPILELLRPDEGRSLAAAEMGARFAHLAGESASAYATIKAESGALDFDDLQTLVRRLLRDGPASIRDELAASLDLLLVDEFQDTDGIQAEILGHLAGAELAGGRLFLVGDPKQSIYRFRGAQPEIFDAFRARFSEHGRLGLTGNFRSVPGVLHFVNALFAETFPGDDQALRPGRGEIEAVDAAVEFLWAGDGSGDATGRRRAEADALASLLSSRLRAGWMVRDPDSGTPRPARPGDVALLFRSRSDFPLYEQAMASQGLDYHVVGGATYFAQQEVIDLLNLLATLDDPLDPLALAGALRGPIFGVSDEGLFWLATRTDVDLPASFQDWSFVADSLSIEDRAAVERASTLLARWRGRKDRVPIATLLDDALAESGFEAALTGEFLGPRKRANVRKLVRLARKFDARGSFSLSDFVARLRADVKTPPREDQAATTDEHGQAIRLMTIHQAKGLEFPIVVLPDLDRRPNQSSDLVAYHPDLGPLVRPGGDEDEPESASRSLGHELFKRIEARADRDEALRVFYVATTRARDVLILSAGCSAEEGPQSHAMKLLAGRFHRGDGSCPAVLPDGWPAPRVRVIDASAPARDRAIVKARHRPKLLTAARRILQAEAHIGDRERAEPVVDPRWVDHDAPRGSASARQAYALVRALLADPRACGGDAPEAVVDEVARRCGLWVTPGPRAAAIEALAAFRRSSVYRSIENAIEVRRCLRWTSSRPDGSVASGRIDFACRSPDGAWDVVLVVLGDEASRDLGEACLRGGMLSAEGLGIAPVAGAWLVRLGDEAIVEKLH